MSRIKILSPETVSISEEAIIEEGVTIYPNNHIFGKTIVRKNAVLYPNNIITDSEIGEGASVTASVLEGAKVGINAQVGPFSHLRKGADVGEGCRIGNYVEIKNAKIGVGSKVSHLTYVGDATVGKDCNIGCGVIFCNYDGKTKKSSVIEDDCFIGSNVNIVAPVTIGKGSFVAAGTTVTKDVERGAFVIGRVRQQENAHLAEKYARKGGKNE